MIQPVDIFVDYNDQQYTLEQAAGDEYIIYKDNMPVYEWISLKQGMLYMRNLRKLYGERKL